MNYIAMILFLPTLILATEIDVEQMTDVTREIERSVSSPTENCETCAGELDQETIHKSLILSSENIDINTSYVGGDNYIIALKRTAETPKKVKIKIEYGERVCARTTAYQNPLSGQIGFGCLFWKTEKRTKTIPLNFEKASVLEGEEFMLKVYNECMKWEESERELAQGRSNFQIEKFIVHDNFTLPSAFKAAIINRKSVAEGLLQGIQQAKKAAREFHYKWDGKDKNEPIWWKNGQGHEELCW